MKILGTLNLLLCAALLATLCLRSVQAQNADTPALAQPVQNSGTEQNYDSSYSEAAPKDGSVVRVDIPSDDLDESREFYGEVFGWTFNASDEVSDRYLYWHDPSGYSGGFSRFIKPGDGSGVVVYLHSDDLDESIKRINRAGGKAFDFKMAIENGSASVALFNDPQGNLMGLISQTN